MKKLISLLTMIFIFNSSAQINIIPKPQVLTQSEGNFVINSQTKVYYQKESESVGKYLSEYFNSEYGLDLSSSGNDENNQIKLVLRKS